MLQTHASGYRPLSAYRLYYPITNPNSNINPNPNSNPNYKL